MADNYLSPKTTKAGMAAIIETLYGGSITFTRMVLGNGSPENPNNVTDVANPLLSVQFTSKTDHSDDGYLLLTGSTNSSQIESSFYGTELGIYAKGDDDQEFLYAYRYSEENADFFPSATDGRTLELQLSVAVQIGNAQSVTAILVEGDAYASKEEFEEHRDRTDNPHQVTAAQVGLGSVPNVSTNDQTPTYTIAQTLTNLVSGETLQGAFGKLARAVANLITHLADNVRHITAAERTRWNSKAEAKHNHSAAEINSGTLGIARGGTGAGTAAAALKALGANPQISVIYSTKLAVTVSNDAITNGASLNLTPGTYVIFCSAGYAKNANGVRQVWLNLGDGINYAHQTVHGDDKYGSWISVFDVCASNKNFTLTAMVRQNSGAPLYCDTVISAIRLY